MDRPLAPYRPAAGDVVVPLPHTLTRATRAGFEAAARAALPASAGVSRAGSEPRLVLDARPCQVADDSGGRTIDAVARAAAAAGVAVVLVDASPTLRALVAATPAGRLGALPLSLAARVEAPPDAPAAADSDVFPLDDAARARLAARRAARRRRP